MSETGDIIRFLRQKAGFSQKTLAKALHITDKAISKWERGICLPDVALLPKLSLLLDVDIGMLVSKSGEQEEWTGLIEIYGCDLSRIVCDKPLVYYLLMHFLLLGIRDVCFLTSEENRAYLSAGTFGEFGFRFSFEAPDCRRLMILHHPWFLFGSNLTDQFRGAMLSGRNIGLKPENQEPVVFFARSGDYFADRKSFTESAASRTLGRGMICLDMSDPDRLPDIAAFIRTYQQNSGLLIGSLEEIAWRRGILSDEKLAHFADTVPYGEMLRTLAGKPQVD